MEKDILDNPSIEKLPISKTDREVYNVVAKFKTCDGLRKYRIKKYEENLFCFEWTRDNSRYFCGGNKFFKTLREAKNFIFTSDCP